MALSCRSWLSNEGGKHLLLLLWLAANVYLFWKTFILYLKGPEYYYLYKMLGPGLCISRASASVLNLNCSLILLPMCRTLLAFLRGSHKVTGRRARRLLDKSKTFHTVCGITISVFSVLHVASHMINAVNFSVNFSEEFPPLNLAHYKGEDPRILIFTTVPGLTGVLLVLILFLMVTASSYSVRLSSYNIFWYSHNLFFIFYIILLLHVAGGALKYQANLQAHPPGCLSPNKTLQGSVLKLESYVDLQTDLFSNGFLRQSFFLQGNFSNICREEPIFKPHFPAQTWLWVSGPLCLYCVERLYRCIRSNTPVTILSVICHYCDVIEVQMLKKKFKARPGQYIVLYCPSISAVENHPFTLTLCPSRKRETFCIHFRVLGDWTKRLQELLLSDLNTDLPVFHQKRYPKLYVDGPFGSPSEDIFNYEVSLCVAGGIGVTPFASVLHSLLDEWRHYKLRRLYFIWVCREIRSFYWFTDLLGALHHKLWEENRPDYLNIQLYLSQSKGIQSSFGEKYQILNSRLFIGRPQWKLIFEEISKSNRQKRVGVFCCGPSKISKTLHKLSNSTCGFGTTFEYNKETFS
ncbi:NADPH oxidase 4 isoform X1 [Erpetoichthys calabaricus]|uniref:NADPH oxidase 4 isoform X1 n=2 Tax=Erpetoichthys calabaricus TaxID=27687 RepID=UPI0010A09727|nr:NADPH oxidase 4 isoform X1 [Erpetoichthys calabaricus]